MTSQSVAGVFGTIVAVVVLAAAFVYGPLGQLGKPARPGRVEQPMTQPMAQPMPAPPPVRGPVVREVPN